MMIEELIRLDHQIFYAINTGLTNPFFDWLLPILRAPFTWLPLYIVIIVYVIKRYRTKGFYLVLALMLTAGLTDLLNSRLLKNYFNRTRPCNEIAFQKDIIVRVPCGSGKSFPSSHASNHFAVAVFLIVMFCNKWRWILPVGVLWAASISFSQVYVGVHFPVDVFFGMLVGVTMGLIISNTFLKYSKFKYE
jgi:membrane-associated phospholipid phosphatase